MKAKYAPLVIGSLITLYVGFFTYQYWLFAFRFEQNLRLIPLLLLGTFGMSGIFIILKQNWARKIAIGYALFQVIISIPQGAVMIAHFAQSPALIPRYFVGLLVSLLSMTCYVFLVYILSRPSIKREFI